MSNTLPGLPLPAERANAVPAAVCQCGIWLPVVGSRGQSSIIVGSGGAAAAGAAVGGVDDMRRTRTKKRAELPSARRTV